MYRISDRRITGTSRKSLNIVKMLCGDDSIVNVVIATSMWNHVDEATGNSREEELRSSDEMFQPLVRKGVKMLRHSNTRDSAIKIITYSDRISRSESGAYRHVRSASR